MLYIYDSSLTQWEFLLGVGPLMTSYWLLCIQVSIISFHLRFILGGSVWIKMTRKLFQFIEDQTHLSTSWHTNMSLTFNELI